jgi:hypothetical protein
MRRLNPRNILNLLLGEFAAHAQTPVSIGDRLLADGITQLIRQCMEAPSFELEVEEIYRSTTSGTRLHEAVVAHGWVRG